MLEVSKTRRKTRIRKNRGKEIIKIILSTDPSEA